jgi:plastocyanin
VSANDVWAVGGYSSGTEYRTLAIHYSDPCGTSTPIATRTSTSTKTPGGPSATPVLTSTPVATATPTCQPAADWHPVIITSFGYTRPNMTVTVGSTVSWLNEGPWVHSTTSDTGVWDSGLLNPDLTYQYVFDTPGTYTYHCTLHSMVGSVTVQALASCAPVVTVTPTSTACSLVFTDVDRENTFYPYAQCLACKGILSGYECGGEGEPCDENNDPYFRPNVNVTRGQIAKIVSNSAGYDVDPGAQLYDDVPSSNTFYQWINRLSARGHMGGYPCGGEGEPCGVDEMPYFRPFANATRAQLAKIVSNSVGLTDTGVEQIFADVPSENGFYVWIQRLASRGIMGGYACGGEVEPCDDQERPYFRPYNSVTRGQTSKIVAGAFYPDCQTPAR